MASKPPSRKKRKMIKNANEVSAPSGIGAHINDLPSELLVRVFRKKFSFVDRLRFERVSPRWRRILWDLVWSDVKKLDELIFARGIEKRYIRKFWIKYSTGGTCNLIPLFKRIGPYMLELDLKSFRKEIHAFIVEIAESLYLLTKLKKLDIYGFNLAVIFTYRKKFARFLPPTLCNLRSSGTLSVRSLEALAVQCPNLQSIPFSHVVGLNGAITGKFIGTFKNIRKLCFWDVNPLKKRSYQLLAEMPNLTVLQLKASKAFIDADLIAIAQRGKLKSLRVQSRVLSDDSIVYLVEHCKFLVLLDVGCCHQLTVRSLNAVLAEVLKRHGNPTRTVPSDKLDKNIFFVNFYHQIQDDFGEIPQHPWLNIRFSFYEHYNDPREII